MTHDADLLVRLRHCTGPLHDRIETLLRLDAPMPLARYGRVVSGFHEFLQLWEARVRAALPQRLHGWFDERRRGQFAASDVAALGLHKDAALQRSAQEAQPLIDLASPDAVFGSLYVLEGSALGGQVLTPRLREHHGLTPEHGASYFHGFGARTGAMWREFRLLAQDEVGHDAARQTAACRAAVQTFEALLATFAPLAITPVPATAATTAD